MVEISTVEEMHSLINAGGKVMLKFGAPWCGPCRTLDPVFKREAEGHTGIIFATVDVQAIPDAAAHFGIRGIPVIMGFKDAEIAFNRPGSPAGLGKAIKDLEAL